MPLSALTGAQPWYLSRGIMGPLISACAIAIGLLTGVEIDAATRAEIAGQVVVVINQAILFFSAAATFGGLILGVWGRFFATKQIAPLAAFLLGLLLISIAGAPKAQAQAVCVPLPKMLAALKTRHQEEPMVTAEGARGGRGPHRHRVAGGHLERHRHAGLRRRLPGDDGEELVRAAARHAVLSG